MGKDYQNSEIKHAPVALLRVFIMLSVLTGFSAMARNTPGIVKSIVANNQQPTINNVEDQKIVSNGDRQSISLTGITAGESDQLVTVSISTSGLIKNAEVDQSSNGNAFIRYGVEKGSSGSGAITVKVTDNGSPALTTTKTINITVTAPATQAVVANQQPTVNDVADLTIVSNGDRQSISLTGISAGESNQSATVSISASGLIKNAEVDQTSNGNAFIRYSVEKGSNGNGAITVKITDNGSPALTTTKTINITVTAPTTSQAAPLAANQQPAVNEIADQTVVSNGDRQSISLTGITAGGPDQSATVTVSASGLIKNAEVDQTSNGNAFIRYSVEKGASGNGSIIVNITNSSNPALTTTKTINITVIAPSTSQAAAFAANQQPVVKDVADQTVVSNGDRQAIALTGISAGGPDQSAMVTVSASGLVENPEVDQTSNGNAFIRYSVEKGSSGNGSITVNVANSNNPALTITKTINITVTAPTSQTVAVAANQQPAVKDVADQTVVSNGDRQSIALTGISAGGPDQSAMVTVSASGLVENPEVDQTSNGNAFIRYGVKKGSSGNGSITVSIANSNNPALTITKTINIIVTASTGVSTPAVVADNQKPVINDVADQTIVSNGDRQSISLTGITAGEPDQITSLAISSSGLVEDAEVNQTSNGNAFIMYGVKEGSSGTGSVTIKITDNGTPALAITKTINITVTAPSKSRAVAPNPAPELKSTNGIVLKGYPNPFIGNSQIQFSTPGNEQSVEVDLFAGGRKIRHLYSGPTEAGHTYSVPLNGSGMLPGLYVAILNTHMQAVSLKIMLAP